MSRNSLRAFGLLALAAALLFTWPPASRVACASSGGSVANGEDAYVHDQLNVELLDAADLVKEHPRRERARRPSSPSSGA